MISEELLISLISLCGGGTLLAILKMAISCLLSENYEWYWHCGKNLLDKSSDEITLSDTHYQPTNINSLPYAKKIGDIWKIKIPSEREDNIKGKIVHIFREFDSVPESVHFLNVNIKKISPCDGRVNIFIRRFTGTGEDRYKPASKGEFKKEVRKEGGVYTISEKSFINDSEYDVKREHIGIMIRGHPTENVEYELTDVLYKPHEYQIRSRCCKRLHYWYRPKKISENTNNNNNNNNNNP
tara:strand:+ start:5381 stop:6100 length:720 start_codon:yes stop_codon:yes gene_type:complete